MQNKGMCRYVFTSSFTVNGFRSFLPELIADIKRIYILKGGSGLTAAAFLRQLGQGMVQRGFKTEFWISSFDLLNPEGVFIPVLNTAIINGQLPQVVLNPPAAARTIDLAQYEDQAAIEARAADISRLAGQISANHQRAGQVLEKAGSGAAGQKIPMKMDGQAEIAGLADNLAERILNHRPVKKHYFASAITAEGMINYIDTISSSCDKRYIFIGPPARGSALIIAEIAGRAAEKGFSLEYYHSGFDPRILSTVIITELRIALVDAGCLAMNLRPGDEIIDWPPPDCGDSVPAGQNGSAAGRRCNILIEEAQHYLENAWQAAEKLKRIHFAAADWRLLDQRREEIIREITREAAGGQERRADQLDIKK